MVRHLPPFQATVTITVPMDAKLQLKKKFSRASILGIKQMKRAVIEMNFNLSFTDCQAEES